MSEQPLPTPGTVDVTPVARGLFLTMLLNREAKGIESYGTTLQTHNGRDCLRDLLEELIDAWQYTVQARLEREALISEVARLRAENAELRGQ